MRAELPRETQRALLEVLEVLRAAQDHLRRFIPTDPHERFEVRQEVYHAVALIESVLAKGR